MKNLLFVLSFLVSTCIFNDAQAQNLAKSLPAADVNLARNFVNNFDANKSSTKQSQKSTYKQTPYSNQKNYGKQPSSLGQQNQGKQPSKNYSNLQNKLVKIVNSSKSYEDLKTNLAKFSKHPAISKLNSKEQKAISTTILVTDYAALKYNSIGNQTNNKGLRPGRWSRIASVIVRAILEIRDILRE